MVSLAARNSMDEYTDREEIIIIDDFRADSMQFKPWAIILLDHITAHQHQLDIPEQVIQYRLPIITVDNRKLVFRDTRKCNNPEED